MRTTLDLDDRVLAIARAKAATDRISLGKAVSTLVLDGLSRPSTAGFETRNGFPVLRSGKPGHVITLELVNQHRDGD
jgi:hypothetical protein